MTLSIHDGSLIGHMHFTVLNIPVGYMYIYMQFMHCFHRIYLFMSLQNLLTFWIRQNSSLVKLIHQISLQIIYSTLLLFYQCHLKHNSFNNEEKDPTKVTVDQLLWNHCYLWGVNVWDNQYFGSLVCCMYNLRQFITLIYICGGVNLWVRITTKSTNIDYPRTMMIPQYFTYDYFIMHFVCNALLHNAKISK